MKTRRLFPLLFLFFFSLTSLSGQSLAPHNWKIEFDFLRLFYHFHSAELSVERKLNDELRFVFDANYYFGIDKPEHEEILSTLKTTTSSDKNYRLSVGVNFYPKETKNLLYRARLSYGNVSIQHRRHVCLEMTNNGGVRECTIFKETILDRQMQQLMLRGGFGYIAPISKHFYLTGYADVGFVKYLVKATGQLENDINSANIFHKYKERGLFANQYSDGAIKLNIDKPQLLFQLSMKIGYAF